MSRKMTQTAGGLAVALGLGAGCGGAVPSPEMSDPKQIDAAIEQSLERLRALQIVDVHGLVLNLPAEATSCYGLPCDAVGEKAYNEERARQAPRLGRLVDVAERLAADAGLAPRPSSEADAAARAVEGLAVVQVSGLIQVQPQNNPQCYNLPCHEDVEAAERENGLRVARAFAIADEAKRSGL